MIKLLKDGQYELIETKNQTKILKLDKKDIFAWVAAEPIGEILISSNVKHKTDHILSLGEYRLYEVKDEPKLTDLLHLELHAGNGAWQGYFLPTGLPNGKRRRRIIPTNEIITKPYIGSLS